MEGLFDPKIWTTGLGILLTSLVLAWVGYTRTTARLAPGEVRYPIGVFAVALASTAFGATCAALSFGAATGGPWVSAVFAVMGALGGYMLVDYLVVRFRASASGLAFRTPWQRGFVAWRNIRTVAWSPTMGWFVVTLEPDRKVYLSGLLAGLPTFAQILLENVDASRINPSAHALLQRAVAGSLPRVG